MSEKGRPSPDITGQRFGRLIALGMCGRDSCGIALWRCVCDCGKEKIARSNNLKSGNTGSCGCLKDESTKHGLYQSSEYAAWANMKDRCLNPKCKSYRNYGARGIKVCARWIDSFPDFYQDMGAKPTPNHSLERKNNSGDYEPGNCCWATTSEQNKNKRYPSGIKRTRKRSG